MTEPDDHDREILAFAVGRVTLASAESEHRLRKVMQEIMGIGGNAWILAEGQSMDWLHQTLPTVLYHEDPWNQIWEKTLHDELLAKNNELRQLQGLATLSFTLYGEPKLRCLT